MWIVRNDRVFVGIDPDEKRAGQNEGRVIGSARAREWPYSQVETGRIRIHVSGMDKGKCTGV